MAEKMNAPILGLKLIEALESRKQDLGIRLKNRSEDSPVWDEYVFSYAIEFYKLFYDHYVTFPDFTAHATEAAKHNAVISALEVLKGQLYNFNSMKPAYERKILDRLSEHIRRENAKLQSTHIPRMAAPKDLPNSVPLMGAYSRARVDVASGSPLLKMAVDEFAEPPTVPLPPHVMAQMEASKTASGPAVSPKSFPAELRRLLEEAKWTPEEVAEETNINWRTVYRHLSGRVRPTPKTRWAYEKAFEKHFGKPTKLPK